MCFSLSLELGPVGWVCKMHQLLLCREIRPSPNECPGYDTKQPGGEVPVMLELWGMQSTPSCPLLPGLLLPGVVTPGRVLMLTKLFEIELL